jgi:hypothetical protein
MGIHSPKLIITNTYATSKLRDRLLQSKHMRTMGVYVGTKYVSYGTLKGEELTT